MEQANAIPASGATKASEKSAKKSAKKVSNFKWVPFQTRKQEVTVMLVFKNRHLGSQKGDLRFEEMKTSNIFAYYVFYNLIKDFSWNIEYIKAKYGGVASFLKVNSILFSFHYN